MSAASADLMLPVAAEPLPGTGVSKRFFLAAIAVVLTAGATWGTWLLWQIGAGGGFTSIPIHQVNAHGHAQLYGWMVLFIMGFAYQAFPRFWRSRLAAPRAAAATFVLMLAGLVLSTLAQAPGIWAGSATAALIGGGLEVIAVTIFAGILLTTWARGSDPAVSPTLFILLALGWLVLSTAGSLWHTWHLTTAEGRDELLHYVRTYQGSLRNAQVHGVALPMIIGVSMRILPGHFGLAPVKPRRAFIAALLLAAAIAGEVGAAIALQWEPHPAPAALLYGSWILMAAAIAVAVVPWRLWRPLPRRDRSGKFIRAAWGWLAISIMMMLAFPAWQRLTGEPFSHAWYGAIRHAFTVGFVSLMIMGVAARIVPSIVGLERAPASALWGPFLLVNTGCALRVSLQSLSDLEPALLPIIGVSGVLEVSGLAWWGIGIAALLLRRRRAPESSCACTCCT